MDFNATLEGLEKAKSLLSGTTQSMQPSGIPQDRTIGQIETELHEAQADLVHSAVRIGQCLKDAHDLIPHGEWLPWLDLQGFSDERARAYIKIAEEFPNSKSIWNLGFTKMNWLTQVPAPERQLFLEDKHVVNGQEKTADGMSTREFGQEVQKWKSRALTAEKELEDEVNLRTHAQQELKARPVIEKDKPVTPPDYEEVKSKLKLAEDRASKALEDAKAASLEAQSYKDYIETHKGSGKSFEAANLIDFQYAVREFLRDATPYVYLGEVFAAMESADREKFITEVSTIERWVYDIKQALAGSSGGANLIILEGGKANG